jgi:hypothetical protein
MIQYRFADRVRLRGDNGVGHVRMRHKWLTYQYKTAPEEIRTVDDRSSSEGSDSTADDESGGSEAEEDDSNVAIYGDPGAEVIEA